MKCVTNFSKTFMTNTQYPRYHINILDTSNIQFLWRFTYIKISFFLARAKKASLKRYKNFKDKT